MGILKLSIIFDNMVASRYNFHLSIYSNCDKIVGTEAYLKTKRGSLSQHFLDCVTDRHYPIALCLDPTKTDQEVLLATIESLSNDSAQMAYKVNFLKASRGIDITPDMLSNFGLLPAIQYSSIGTNNIVDAASQNGNGAVSAYPVISSQSSVIAVQEIPIAKKDEEGDEYEEDEDDDEDEDESQMSDEEYLASKRHLFSVEIIK